MRAHLSRCGHVSGVGTSMSSRGESTPVRVRSDGDATARLVVRPNRPEEKPLTTWATRVENLSVSRAKCLVLPGVCHRLQSTRFEMSTPPPPLPPGCELANRAVQHDENGEWQLAIECYVRAADEIEAFLNSGQPVPPNIDFAHHVEAYRTRASELTQDYSQEIAAQPGNNSAASVSATASSMFQKFKSTAAKAASKTKETAIIVGNTAKSAANSAYTAAGTRGTFANKVADGVAVGLGHGFGWTFGRNAAHAASNALFPAPLRRRRWC